MLEPHPMDSLEDLFGLFDVPRAPPPKSISCARTSSGEASKRQSEL